jgi:hypothetical protein
MPRIQHRENITINLEVNIRISDPTSDDILAYVRTPRFPLGESHSRKPVLDLKTQVSSRMRLKVLELPFRLELHLLWEPHAYHG